MMEKNQSFIRTLKMKRLITIYILLFCLGTNFGLAQSYSPVWATSPSGTLKDDVAGTTTDLNGNVLVIGHFASQTITFGSTTLTNVGNIANGYTDAYLVKYDSSGNVLWAIRGGGLYNDDCSGISTDGSGKVIITGTTNSAYFSFGSVTVQNTQSYQVFVVKLDASGSVIWVKLGGGTQNDYASSITTDGIGNVFVSGSFSSSTITFGTATLNKTPASIGSDFFVVKYDSSGNAQWVRGGGGSQPDVCRGISADPSGNVFISGFFQSSSILIGTTSLSNSSSTFGFSDIFVAKYDSSGNLMWAHDFGGNDNEEIYGISADAYGNAYIAGTMGNFDITFGNFNLTNGGSAFTYIVKFDASGNVLWAKNEDVYSFLYDISTDIFGNVYLTGNFSDNVITIGSVSLVNAGDKDFYIAKYDSGGTTLWAQRYGGIFSDNSIEVAIDNNQNIYTVGHFYGPTITLGSNVLNNSGAQDIFILKNAPCLHSSSNLVIASCDNFTSPSGNYTYTSSGIYYDTIPNFSGCDSVLTINLTINPSPVVTITSQGSTTFCRGDSVLLSATTGLLNYQWYSYGNIITGATSESMVVKNRGRFKCVAQNAQQCAANSNIIAVHVPCIPLGPNHQKIENINGPDLTELIISPNPGNGVFEIFSPPGILKIFNSTGKLVYSKELLEIENNFDISGFADGIYFVQLKADHLTLYRKLILSH